MTAPRKPWFSLPMLTIRASLLATLSLLILALSGVILAVSYQGSTRIALNLASQYMSQTEQLLTGDLDAYFQPVSVSLHNARQWAQRSLFSPHDVEQSNALFIPLMQSHPQITSIATGDEQGYSYRIGFADGGFQNRISHSESKSPHEDYYLWSPEQKLLRQWSGKSAESPESVYDARTRPWYEGAQRLNAGSEDKSRLFWSEPFFLHTSRMPGISASIPVPIDGKETFYLTFNLMLTRLTHFTSSLKPSANGLVVLLQDDRVIGYPASDTFLTPKHWMEWIHERGGELPQLDELGDAALTGAWRAWEAADEQERSGVLSFHAGDEDWRCVFKSYDRTEENRDLWIVILIPETDIFGEAMLELKLISTTAFVAILISVLLAIGLARMYSKPMRELAMESERITALDLSPGRPVDTHVLEAHQLAVTQQNMRNALDSFSRYIPTEVVKQLLQAGKAAQLGGRKTDVTVLFTDIENFTRIAESLDPEELAAHLAGYFAGVMEVIRDEKGTIDKMIGDAVMALWGAPLDLCDHARRAVRTCLRCQEFLTTFNRQCVEDGKQPLLTRFGLATGAAMVGNFGSPKRLNYTAFGDTVNLAQRLEGANKVYGTHILAAAPVREQAGDDIVWRKVDTVVVKGKTLKVNVYEPLGFAGHVDAEATRFATFYETVLAAYQDGKFTVALEQIEAASPNFQKDLGVIRIAKRCREFADRPLDDWDGASQLESK